MTELLKTPGKMRGKTPRTARKRNPDESRVVCISAADAYTVFWVNQKLASERNIHILEPEAESAFKIYSGTREDCYCHETIRQIIRATRSETC